jgi:hypothetical protein
MQAQQVKMQAPQAHQPQQIKRPGHPEEPWIPGPPLW